MWFLWALITFLVVIFSTAQIISYVICFLRYPELMEDMPAKNKSMIIGGLILHAIINVTWIIVVCMVSAIREHWIAIVITAAIALFFSINGIRNDETLYSTFKNLTGAEEKEKTQAANEFFDKVKKMAEARSTNTKRTEEDDVWVDEDEGSSKSKKIQDADEMLQKGIINFEQYANLREQIDAGAIPDSVDEDFDAEDLLDDDEDDEDYDEFFDEDDLLDEEDEEYDYDELLKDDEDEEVLTSVQRTKLENLFKMSFRNVIKVESTVIKNKQSKVYYFSPASSGFTSIGAFYYLVEVGVRSPRYFALECSYDQQYMLCEWVFENGKEKSHINYGVLINGIADLMGKESVYDRLIKKVKTII